MAALVLNGGSTGWKLAVYDDVRANAVPVSPARAEVALASPLEGADADALVAVCKNLARAGALDDLRAIGHRIVHGGGRFTESVRIDSDVETALRSFEPLAPSHARVELAGIDAMRNVFPSVPQVAVFDTSFHRTLPPAAFTYPGPYAWREQGIRRFGFHGSSVAYCLERASQMLDRRLENTNLIVAHLGGGASVTAVRGGKSVDTSMGFTPLDGIMMGTRSGTIDPGILIWLARERAVAGESAADIVETLDGMLNHGSGLVGISGVSSDVREVEEAARAGNERATLALELFAQRAATAIGGTIASLDRIDALVFTGGIGEHAASMRARICGKLGLLGLDVDERRNAAEKPLDRRIDCGATSILVIETREEWFVARECARVLD